MGKSYSERKVRVELKCAHCEKLYEVIESRIEDSKYCSQECFYAGKYGRETKTVKLKCEACGADFEKPFVQRDRRFCSYSCANTGENNGMFGRSDLCVWTGKQSWNHGLTAKTDVRIAAASKKLSDIVTQKIVDGSWSPPVTKFKSSYFESAKCGKTFYCRSSYERRYLELLESDPDVTSYEVEPIAIPYVFDGRIRNYIPDVLVTRVSCGQQLVEVKPTALTETVQNVTKADAARVWCKQNGINFLVVSESDLTAHRAST